MAVKVLKSKSYDDYSKGAYQSVGENLAPENSVKLNLNMDSDDTLGDLVLRKGSTLINAQIIDAKPVLGLHNFRDSVGSGSKLFAVLSDGTNNDIYDVLTGSKSLQDDTKDLKTRFLTYLDACLRLNGTDAPKWWNGISWKTTKTGATFTVDAGTDTITSAAHGLLNGDIITVSAATTIPTGLAASTNYYVRDKGDNTFKLSATSGGAAIDITDTGTGTLTWYNWDPFNVANFPSGAKFALEFKDRIHVGGFDNNPDRVDISGIANSNTRTVSWTVDNKFILLEQEDGGGGLTGIAKVPGYVLYFKKRTMKRYDGSSAYPEDMINHGVISQECIVVADTICFFANNKGAWATEGGKPKKISTFNVDKVIKSLSAANWATVASGTDEEHVYWSFSSVTMNKETFANVVLKYNINQNTWDIRQYPTMHRVYTKYIDSSGEEFLTTGDDDGNVLKLNIGTTDNGTPITFSVETQDWTFGFPLFIKSISQIGFVTEGISKGRVMWRETGNPEDWKPLCTIDKEEVLLGNIDIRATRYNFKITDTTDSGSAIVKGIHFPQGIKVFDSSTT